MGDARACGNRAAALGLAPYEQPRGEGELAIPAIRGLGGSLVHFLDEGLDHVWEAEFTATGSPANGVGLTRVDHIAQTMSYDSMLSWSLFYQAQFAMKRAAMVDVIDPDGLVRSQAIAAGDGALRITLNGAETYRTLAGNFLADSFGASVQHVAFACEDILASAGQLAARGFQVLPMGANYYDDLASRFDLAPDHLARLRAANALYDEDAGGRFHQIYSRPFASGMFVEIVQRDPGYRGYGAPNAPYRIAALKRLMRHASMPRA